MEKDEATKNHRTSDRTIGVLQELSLNSRKSFEDAKQAVERRPSRSDTENIEGAIIIEYLNRLEGLAQQTGLDVEQLCDRLKNNNNNLNRLLNTISDYSEQVAGESNTIRKEVSTILTNLETLGSEFEKYNAIVTSTADTLLKYGPEEVKEKGRYNPNEFHEGINKIESFIEKHFTSNEERTSSLSRQIEKQNKAIEEISKKLQLASDVKTLEQKVASLETKYLDLKQLYEEKYSQLQVLRQDYASFLDNVADSAAPNNSNPYHPHDMLSSALKIDKVRRFHTKRIREIEKRHDDTYSKEQSRIVSTPLPKDELH